MKFKLIISLVITVLFIVACKKSAIEINPDFEGEWHSEPFGPAGSEVENYFIIDGSQGVFGEFCELNTGVYICNSVFKGAAEMNKKGTKLFIGDVVINQSARVNIEIDVAPFINSEGNWQCEFGERVYIKN